MHDHSFLPTWFGNTASMLAIVGSIAGALPAIAAVIAVIWYIIQITESDTFRNWLHNRRARRASRLRAKLTALETTMALEPRQEDHGDPPRHHELPFD